MSFINAKHCLALLLILFAGFCFWKSDSDNPTASPVSEATTVSSTQGSHPAVYANPSDRLITSAIQDLRIGMRVPGRNPIESDTERDLPDPEPKSWRSLSVRMEHKPGKFVDAELLRPLHWIEQVGASPGKEIWLSLAEMHTAGYAEVLSISPCPAIETGTGSVITGTFRHESDSVVDVRVSSLDEPIGTTAKHPFWSENRQDFIPAFELRIGEEVRTADETLALITSITPRDGPQTVYGLEVYGEHVYHVGLSGLLVHNASTNAPRVVEPRTLTQQRELSRMAQQTRDEWVNDFDALFDALDEGQINKVVENPWMMVWEFGTALEIRVAQRVRQIQRSTPDGVFGTVDDFVWTGRTNAPQDFIDMRVAGRNGGNFGHDITGNSVSSVRKHFDRLEIDALSTYESIPADLGYRFVHWLGNQ